MDNENKKVERPLCLELTDGKQEIFDAISEVAKRRNIPFFLLEYILSEALQQVKTGAKNEIAQASLVYERRCMAAEQKGGKEEKNG